MTYNFIRTRKDGYVFTLTLARPEKRNAFTPTMVNEMDHALKAANADKEVRVVVVDAEGPVFCAGMDLKAFTDPGEDRLNPAIVNRDLSLGEVMAQLNKPSVALVEGKVVAGGFLVVAECTFVLARPKAEFSLPEVKIGIFPFQVLASLLKVLPEKKAMQLCISAEPFSARQALEYGIVDELLEEGAAERLINRLAENAPLAVSRGFEALKALRETDPADRFSYLKAELDRLRHSQDAQEGIQALFEKRKPEWKNQ